MPTVRTFISIVPPPDVLAAMAELQRTLRSSESDIGWEAPSKFHATLKFMGDVDDASLREISATIGHCVAGCSPVEMIFEGLGAFPTLHNPRVIWIGCTDSAGTALRIKMVLDRSLIAFGCKADDRPFHPHVTLGRVRSNRNLGHLLPMLEKCTFEPRRATLDTIFLMKSVLRPQGAEYSVLQSIHLRQ